MRGRRLCKGCDRRVIRAGVDARELVALPIDHGRRAAGFDRFHVRLGKRRVEVRVAVEDGGGLRKGRIKRRDLRDFMVALDRAGVHRVDQRADHDLRIGRDRKEAGEERE